VKAGVLLFLILTMNSLARYGSERWNVKTMNAIKRFLDLMEEMLL